MEKKISPNLTLFALAINAFAIGSTEFISVGLLLKVFILVFPKQV